MKRRSLVVAGAAMVALAFTSTLFVSCDGNSSNPSTPIPGNGNGKSGQTLDGPLPAGSCITAVALTNCPVGEATLTIEDGARIKVSGFDADGGNGYKSTFDGINNYGVQMDADLGNDPNGSLKFEASDAGGGQASLTISRDPADINNVQLSTNFTAAVGVETQDISVLDNGVVVATQENVPLTDKITIINGGCLEYLKTLAVSWQIRQSDGRCILRNLWEKCALVTIKLPNGTQASGNEIKIVENNDRGSYPYTLTNTWTTTGTSINSITITAAHAFNAQ